MARRKKKGKVKSAVGMNGVACIRGKRVRVSRIHRKKRPRLPLFDALGDVVKTVVAPISPPTILEKGRII